MKKTIGELLPPTRLMMTPGPSCMDPRVYRAMSAPLVGHLDPWFLEMMNDVQILLRRVFQTENRITYPHLRMGCWRDRSGSTKSSGRGR